MPPRRAIELPKPEAIARRRPPAARRPRLPNVNAFSSADLQTLGTQIQEAQAARIAAARPGAA